MFGRIGIITNCWKIALENGASFEELVIRFCEKGFNDIEIRDGDYLRRSSAGELIGIVEKTAAEYSGEEWREISDRIHRRDEWRRGTVRVLV